MLQMYGRLPDRKDLLANKLKVRFTLTRNASTLTLATMHSPRRVVPRDNRSAPLFQTQTLCHTQWPALVKLALPRLRVFLLPTTRSRPRSMSLVGRVDTPTRARWALHRSRRRSLLRMGSRLLVAPEKRLAHLVVSSKDLTPSNSF